ncbi:MAG: TauD/TfdA family dioxygenase [Magnetospiraceae bacterium]
MRINPKMQVSDAGDADRGPFSLEDNAAYIAWRDQKLQSADTRASDLLVLLRANDFENPKTVLALQDRVQRSNMAFFKCPHPLGEGKDVVRKVGAALGLVTLDHNLEAEDDGITPLSVAEEGSRARYIPYTNKAMRWHTDGYYNSLDRRINAMILYCHQAPESGDGNRFLDHEIVYILLREANPDYIRALMRPDVLTIPGNCIEGDLIRPDQTGPVFSIDPDGGFLHMRYTRRARNVVWRNDPLTQEAVAYLEREILDSDSPYIISQRMAPGEGVICNNVLHDRAPFLDSETNDDYRRLVYRARYLERIDTPDPIEGV